MNERLIERSLATIEQTFFGWKRFEISAHYVLSAHHNEGQFVTADDRAGI